MCHVPLWATASLERVVIQPVWRRHLEFTINKRAAVPVHFPFGRTMVYRAPSWVSTSARAVAMASLKLKHEARNEMNANVLSPTEHRSGVLSLVRPVIHLMTSRRLAGRTDSSAGPGTNRWHVCIARW